MNPLITLLTDFGMQDSFVGEMKGRIWSICPRANIVDLTHSLPSHEVEPAAFAWKTATASFPRGSVHVAVVDPGVGTARRVLVAELDGSYYVCPDNGLLTWLLEDAASAKIIHANNPAYWSPDVSSTFHGRDIFAPLAAHLACGVQLAALGTRTSQIARLTIRKPRLQGDVIEGQPLLADRFGNLLTNLSNDLLDLAHLVEFGDRTCKPVQTYAEGRNGELLILRGSHGYLELAMNRASVVETIPAALQTNVKLHLRK